MSSINEFLLTSGKSKQISGYEMSNHCKHGQLLNTYEECKYESSLTLQPFTIVGVFIPTNLRFQRHHQIFQRHHQIWGMGLRQNVCLITSNQGFNGVCSEN